MRLGVAMPPATAGRAGGQRGVDVREAGGEAGEEVDQIIPGGADVRGVVV